MDPMIALEHLRIPLFQFTLVIEECQDAKCGVTNGYYVLIQLSF
jgi:hypothetical protein